MAEMRLGKVLTRWSDMQILIRHQFDKRLESNSHSCSSHWTSDLCSDQMLQWAQYSPETRGHALTSVSCAATEEKMWFMPVKILTRGLQISQSSQCRCWSCIFKLPKKSVGQHNSHGLLPGTLILKTCAQNLVKYWQGQRSLFGYTGVQSM